MSETPRYATLRDYLRVVKTQRRLILAITAVFALAGLAVSLLQTPTYTAGTSLTFRDIGQDLSLLGDQALPELAPAERAAIKAEVINRPGVAERVKEDLETDLTVEDLRSSVSTQVGVRTNFVIINAESGDAEFAAELANAYGSEVKALDEEEVRRRLDSAIKNLQAGSPGPNTVEGQITQQRISQLQTARALARPVEISRPAEVPGSPSSPRPRRNTFLGAVVGLAIGLLTAFLRDSLDRRLRVSDDVQDELQLPVIGRVPDGALGEIGFVANGPVAPEVEAYLEAFRVLRTNLEFLQVGNPMRSVMVTSGLPEEGKSTVAIALAGANAVAGKRTLLVECDLRRPCMADRLGLDREPGLSDYLVGHADPKDVLQTVELTAPISPNGDKDEAEKASQGPKRKSTVEGGAIMACITAGSSVPLPAELLGSERFTDFLTKVSKAYDLVVLDTSPILAVVDALELVPHVDGMVVCVRLSQTTREEARAAREALAHLPERPTGVVVTGVRPGEDSYGYYYGSYGEPVY